MEIERKAIEELVSSIKKFISKAHNRASFDVTKQGIIEAVLDGNRYRVKLEGATYVVPSVTNQVFGVNDTVLVLLAQNDINKKYIMGKAG